MSRCIVSGCIYIKNIPLFSFPKSDDKLKEWERRISDGATKIQEGDKICIRHFEKKFIEKNSLLPNAIPTLFLESSKGNTVDDFEEMIKNENKPVKKKRGSSGLRNLQIAREKRNLRKERMKRIAEMRRQAKLQNSKLNREEKNVEKTKKQVYDVSKDYFLGDREESELEKVLISLRLPQHLHSSNSVLKHPSSIRNVQTFPLFNSIKHMEKLVNMNPVFWDQTDTLAFIQHFTPLKNIIKRFQNHEVTGETILNLTKNDLINSLNIDNEHASILIDKFEQLRRETIMRYAIC